MVHTDALDARPPYISGMRLSRIFDRARTAAVAVLLLPRLLAAQDTAPLYLVHANVVDGVTATVIRDATIVIEGSRITRIAPGLSTPRGGGVRVIDLAGRWVAPGLIDAHTHIATLANARRALFSGVTTIRSASVPA